MTDEILPSGRRIISGSHGDIIPPAFNSPTDETDAICAGVETALKHWDNPVVRDQLDKLLVVAKLVDSEYLGKREKTYAHRRQSQDFSRRMKSSTELFQKGLISKTTMLKMLNDPNADEDN